MAASRLSAECQISSALVKDTLAALTPHHHTHLLPTSKSSHCTTSRLRRRLRYFQALTVGMNNKPFFEILTANDHGNAKSLDNEMLSYNLFTLPTQTRQNCLVLFYPCRWFEHSWWQDSFVSSRPSFDEFCLVLTQFPICNCLVSNILTITENFEIRNWV